MSLGSLKIKFLCLCVVFESLCLKKWRFAPILHHKGTKDTKYH